MVRALWRAAVTWFDTGTFLVSWPEQERRRRICEACPLFLAHSRQCSACTCLVDVKTLLKSEECPKGKWKRWGRTPPK